MDDRGCERETNQSKMCDRFTLQCPYISRVTIGVTILSPRVIIVLRLRIELQLLSPCGEELRFRVQLASEVASPEFESSSDPVLSLQDMANLMTSPMISLM